MARKHLNSTREVIDALGGLDAVVELTGRSYPTVSGWQSNYNAFPAQLYVLMTQALFRAGYTAPDHLWGQSTAYPQRREEATNGC